MKRDRLLHHLRRHGCVIRREGKEHSLWENPQTGHEEAVPRHAEIAKLLKADAALKVYVVGHTDNVAALELNLKLSQARAEAVMQALMSQHGVAAARLAARGVGPLAPVASNDNDEGRAKNRRVELVKQ